MQAINEAIQHVRENKTWTKRQEALVIEDIVRYRCPIEFVDDDIANEIETLMDEYGDDLELPNGWWKEVKAVDDIFWEL